MAIAILASSCSPKRVAVVTNPLPAAEWKAVLQECRPAPEPEQSICPRHMLERTWDVMAEQHMAVVSCKRDLQTAEELCKVRVARAEARTDSIWYQWWFWSIAGIAVGAVITTGIFWGDQIVP